MKVLLVSDLYSTSANGVVTSVNNLAEGLRNNGHDVRILTLSENTRSYAQEDVFYVKSFSLDVIYPHLRGSKAKDDELIKELIVWGPEIIHTQSEFFTFQFAKKIAKVTGAPIIHTCHTQYEDYIRYVIPWKRLGEKLLKPFLLKRFNSTSMVIVPSNKTGKFIRKIGYKGDSSVIPSGIDLKRYQERTSQKRKKEILDSMGIPEDAFVLLSLGRLAKEKNVGDLLMLFAWLLFDLPKAFLIVVGDGPEKEFLEKYAEELGILGRVHFTGEVSQEDVFKYYQVANVFVSASKSETQGLVYIEAAANGLPLVCRRDPCLDGVLEDGGNGYFYDSPEDFSNDIERYFRNEKLRVSAGMRSMEIAEGYGIESFADSIDGIYSKVLAEQNTRKGDDPR